MGSLHDHVINYKVRLLRVPLLCVLIDMKTAGRSGRRWRGKLAALYQYRYGVDHPAVVRGRLGLRGHPAEDLEEVHRD